MVWFSPQFRGIEAGAGFQGILVPMARDERPGVFLLEFMQELSESVYLLW